MGVVWVECVVVLDVNASYGPCHPTILSLYRGTVRRTNFVQSMLSTPLSLFSASQRTRGAYRLFAHMRSHMSVKMQADPLNLHIFHLDMLVMKNKSKKDLRWLLLELLKSSKILFTF